MTSTCTYIKSGLAPGSRAVKCFDRATLAELCPVWDVPFIALVDGRAVLRRDWDITIYTGHAVVFIDAASIPQGGGGGSNPLRLIASLAIIAMSFYLPGSSFLATTVLDIATYTGLGGGLIMGAMSAAIMIGGMALVNAVLPPQVAGTTPTGDIQAASPTYNLQAQGNYARLNGAIPEHFGRHICYPDFAAQPYSEAHGNEVYLYQLLVIGRGYYDIEAISIEDTPIDNFDEITYEIIEPYGDLTLFPSNVEVSSEVSGQDLPTGTYVGPFTAVGEENHAIALGIDFVAPRGLYYANDDGTLASQTATAQIEARLIDVNGDPLGSWTTLGTVSYSKATTTPQRYSERFTVTSGRYEVRVKRTDTEQTGTRYGHDLVWSGLRAYLPETGNFGDVTMLAVKMQASSQLSAQASRKINVVATRKLQAWSGTSWGSYAPTRSIAWAAAYCCKQAGLTDDRIDLAQLVYLNSVWSSRGDECNGRIDGFISFWDALAKICAAGRCKPYQQAGIIRFHRDQQQTMPSALFSMRNIVKGSMSVQYIMPSEETADCVEVSYFDSEVWRDRRVTAQLEGSTALNPFKADLPLVTSRARAIEHGLYQAACNQRRRKMITFQTEMDGFIPSFGDLIAIQHDIPAWGQSGEIVDYATAENNVRGSERLYDSTYWVNGYSGVDSWPCTASTDIPDPRGGSDPVTKFTAHAGTTDRRLFVRTMASSFAPGTKTISIWIYVPTQAGVTHWQFNADYNDLESASGTVQTVFDAWVRVDCQVWIGDTRTWIDFNIRVQDWPWIPDEGFIFYATGAQENWGDAVDAYVPTTSAAITEAMVLTTSEPTEWASGNHYIALRHQNGAMAGPYQAYKSLDPYQVVLHSPPEEITPYIGDAADRTMYAFGAAETYAQEALVLSVKPRGKYSVEIQAVNEDDSVHTADQGYTLPAPVTSQLVGYTAAPTISGLIVRSSTTDVDTMLLSWSPSPWAEYYLIDISADGEAWTRIGEPTSNNFTAKAIYGSQTQIRVAAVGATRGPWVQVGYGGVADYMWDATDSTLMWSATTSDLMWSA